MESGCPDDVRLEMLLAGEDVGEDVRAHVEVCDVCGRRLADAAQSDAFLTRVRRLTTVVAGPDGSLHLAGYRALSVLSRGAQGVVYRAVQESTSRPVAIKTLSASVDASPRSRLRAEREAEIAGRLRHPNIVTIYESRFLADGRVAVVMELVEGVPLDRWTPAGTTPEARLRSLLGVFATVCTAIHHAHLNGVIHRDLKPDNILVTKDGRPVVLDFGIAKAGGISTTRTGDFAGTPAYASPEQASMKNEAVDALTDVYSLGVILYKLVCGALPYDVEGSLFEMAHTIGHAEPVRPTARDAGIPRDVEAIVLRAIRKEKERRYQSAASFGRDIERYLAGEPVEARSASGWYVLRKAVSLNRRLFAGALAGAAVLAAAGAAVWISVSNAAESDRRAALEAEQARAENVRARAVAELLREAMPASDPLRPEVSRLVSAGLGRLYIRLETGAFAAEPDLDQAIRRMWAEIYTGFGSGKAAGLIEYAEVSLRNGLVRLRERYGPEHPEIAATMHDLAGVMLVRRRLGEAERTAQQALAMRQKLLGPTHPDTIDTIVLRARVLLAEGRAAEAEETARLAIARAGPTPARPLAVAWARTVLGRIRLDAGDGAGAEPLVREALEIRLRRLSPEDPDLVASLNDAAAVAELEPIGVLASALSAAWPAPGEEVADRVRAAASTIAAPDRGDNSNPVSTGRTATLGGLLSLAETLLGRDDPALIRVLTAQMNAAWTERVYSERAAAAVRVIELLSARAPVDRRAVLLCLEEAAPAFFETGRTHDAAETALRAVDMRRAEPAETRDMLMIANSKRFAAWFLLYDGRIGAALEMIRTARSEFATILGDEHYIVAACDGLEAQALAWNGRAGEAEAISERAMRLIEGSPATPSDLRTHARVFRAVVLAEVGRFAEARTQLTRAWEESIRLSHPANGVRLVLLRTVIGCCDRLGDAEGAAAWRATAGHDLTNASYEWNEVWQTIVAARELGSEDLDTTRGPE